MIREEKVKELTGQGIGSIISADREITKNYNNSVVIKSINKPRAKKISGIKRQWGQGEEGGGNR